MYFLYFLLESLGNASKNPSILGLQGFTTHVKLQENILLLFYIYTPKSTLKTKGPLQIFRSHLKGW